MFRFSKSIAAAVMVLPFLTAGIGCQSTGTVEETRKVTTTTELKSGSTVAADTTAKPVVVAAPAAAATTAKPVAQAPAAAVKPVAIGSAAAFIPTGKRETSVLAVEKVAPAQLYINQPVEFTTKVTNITSGKIDDVVLTETAVNGFKVDSTTPQGTTANGKTSFALGSLAAGETKTIVSKGMFAEVGQYSSCSTAAYVVPVCMAVNVTAPPVPALKLVKAAPAEGTPCDVWPIKITVSNTGTGTAKNVVVRDALPAGLLTADGKSTFEQAVGDLAAGASKDLTFNVKADKAGAYANTATAAADGDLKASSNTTTTAIKQAVLALDVKCPPAEVRLGAAATYQITVTNKGDAVANNTVVRMPVAQGVRFDTATEGGLLAGTDVTWQLGALNPGQSKTVAVTTRAMTAGTFKSGFVATATCAAQVANECTIVAAGAPDIAVGIIDDTGVVPVGNNHVFRYQVKNQGQVPLTNTTVVYTADAGLEFVSSTPASTAAGQVVTIKLGTLAVGQTVDVPLTYKGTAEGQLKIVAITTTDQTREMRNEEQVNFVK